MDWLSILWFILIAVLWTGYLALEGFDIGVGMLLRILGKSDRERAALIKTIAPFWDGNEVWLLTAGGATFAAFPEWYATMFSGMYLALFLILLALILRICAIEWRAKINSPKWRGVWDTIHFVVAWLPPILFGVAFANLVQGMKIEVINPQTLEVISPSEVTPEVLSTHVHAITGGFFSLLSPFTLLGGVILACIFLAHGSLFLTLRTTGELRQKSEKLALPLSIVATLLTAVWALWAQFAYSSSILSLVPLAVAALSLISSTALTLKKNYKFAFAVNFLAIASAVAFIFSAMAPSVMKSSIDPAYSLTIAQASSTHGTLTVMTIVAVTLVPVVLAYTIWSYWVFRARVSEKDIPKIAGLDPKRIRLGANFLSN
ncbi:cytochrome d ubiquinol oxidase subunit II [Actinomyces sp. zg-332]|uniref:cytochrome d ubiquinol oxidase subunit II n=1 Tax=Actinomyces sp. zg-332 TaxID=2708340 RepID=UPI00141DF630|nr:cytochrome d ubiquinol oxidase subunit II [Actinomyces sp. zg-332]QPK94454.1 cytochrome d ubiquinol oxidase subunit II [Actinomyces sp. zg-332]